MNFATVAAFNEYTGSYESDWPHELIVLVDNTFYEIKNKCVSDFIDSLSSLDRKVLWLYRISKIEKFNKMEKALSWTTEQIWEFLTDCHDAEEFELVARAAKVSVADLKDCARQLYGEEKVYFPVDNEDMRQILERCWWSCNFF